MSLDPVTGGGTAERVFQLSRYLNFEGVENRILTTSLGINENRLNDLTPAIAVVLPLVWKRFYLPLPRFKKIFDQVIW